ncbi:MAG: hypothetical protein ACTSR8_01145 [Promethearchaeota archaeon]
MKIFKKFMKIQCIKNLCIRCIPILFLPVTILCVLFTVLMFIHIIRTWNHENKHFFKKLNEVVYALLTLAFGLYYPFIILSFGGNHKGVIFPTAVEELTFLGNLFIVGVMMGIFGWAISAKIRTIRNPELLKEQNNYEAFCKKFLEEYPDKNPIKRKITHILPVGVVTGCIIIFYFLTFFDGTWLDYAMFFIIIIGIDFAFTFLLQDLIRLYDFSYMPPNAIKMCEAGLTPDELDTFTSTSVMVFAFGPFVFFSFPIFYIVILITAVADAMASIFGILASKKGIKHIFPSWSDKSIEGYIGGSLFTFICVVFAIGFSNFFGISNISISIMLGLALLLSLEFFLIDIITTKIELQDNYVNPLITGFTAVLYLIVLNIAIF